MSYTCARIRSCPQDKSSFFFFLNRCAETHPLPPTEQVSTAQSRWYLPYVIPNVYSCLSCANLCVCSFYNGVGDVNVDVIKKILADNKQVKPMRVFCISAAAKTAWRFSPQESVIGWYRQRRNTDQQMTFREKFVHEKLKSSLSNPHMIFLLLTPSSLTPPGSTHRMEYAAFISHSRWVSYT